MTRLFSTHSAHTVVVLALAVLLSACGARLTAEEKVELARSQIAEGKAADAAIHLRNVLQDDPSNVAARILLAESALKVGDVETALKEYRRAIDLGADVNEFRTSYAESLVRAGAVEEALRVTDPADAGEPPALSYWRSLALLRSGAMDEAEALLQRVAGDTELEPRARVALARVAIARQQPDGALSMLEELGAGELGEEASKRSEYWEAVALAATMAGQHDRAAEALTRAAATVVDASGRQQFMYRGGEVEALLAAGKLDEARTRAEKMHAEVQQHPLANYLMGRVELQSGNPQQALAYGQAVLAAQPDSAQGHLLVAMAHLGLEQNLQAERSLERVVTADPENVVARRLLAQTRLGMQSPDRALEALGPLTGDNIDPALATLAGVASVRAGDPEAAVEIFRRQLASEPGNDQARSMLAVSLMALGRIDEALAELRSVASTDAAVRQQAGLIEVAAHLQAGALDDAREASAALAAENPGDAALRANLGGLFLSGNHLDEATAWLEESRRIDPNNIAARFNLGRIAGALGQIGAAREEFEAILSIDPENGAALAALAQLDWATGDRGSALDRLQKARAADSRDLNSRFLLASYLTSMDRDAEAIEVAREAVEAAPESAVAANILGTALLQAGNGRESLAEFVRAHQISPGVAQYLINKASAETALGQLETARETLVQALALEPDSLRGLALMVNVERRLGRLDGAARAFARLERAAPSGDFRVELVRGELLLAQEDYSGAEVAFAEAGTGGAGRRSATGIYEARVRAGAPAPEQPLIDWLESQPGDSQVRVVLGTHYIQARNYPAAVAEHERLVQEVPDNAGLMNNLAWLYNEVGDPRALEMAERAHEAAPENPMIADTYGWILHQQGDTQRALELIGAAAAGAPRVGEIQYHHAVVLAATGDTAGAMQAARAVLAEPSAANFHEPAQKLLDRLEQGKE